MLKKKETPARRKPEHVSIMSRCISSLAPEVSREISRSMKIRTALHSDHYVDKWISAHLTNPRLKTNTISLNKMQGWLVHPATGDICHESGRFFSITGVDVKHRSDSKEIAWDQPLIDQPEVGILGIIGKKINGILHFCLHAKEEPGNINSVQLSPTLQATYSNYSKVHGGTPPRFLEHFLDSSKGKVIYAKLQTEDGGRFLYKSNRNMIVQVDESSLQALPEGFIWLTLRQICRLLKRDNLIHACTRSVLSALALPERTKSKKPSRKEPAKSSSGCNSLVEIIQWLDNRKAVNHFQVKKIALNNLKDWSMDRDGSFSHQDGRYFRVIGIDVASSQREVSIWNQPILDNPGTGIIGLLTKESGGKRYFLMQAKAELGNRGIVQIGPTVQFTPGNYDGNEKIPKPFLFEAFCNPEKSRLLIESTQSEEGARFNKEAHIHRIISHPDTEEITYPDDFFWISQADLNFFINMGDSVNSCARSIISLMLCEIG